MVRVGFVVLASPLHDRRYLSELSGRLLGCFGGGVEFAGVFTDESGVGELRGFDGLVAVVGTGGSERVILAVSELGVPVVYVVVPYANSLPAFLEALPLVVGRRVSWVVLESLDDVCGVLRGAYAALVAVARLRGFRLGLVGGVSPWLVYSVVDARSVRRVLGVEVVSVGLEEVVELFRRGCASASVTESVISRALACRVGASAVVEAVRLYAALKALVRKYRLDGLTIKCFDLIGEVGTTACLALALLNDEGVVAACEGDVPAALTMALLKLVSGKPCFMANPAAIRGSKVLFAHCTCPISIGVGYELDTHFETGVGVGVATHFREGEEVTVARLSPKLDRIRVFKGVVVQGTPTSRMHCRTQVLVDLGNAARKIVDESLGNHHILVPGNYVEELKHAARLLGIKAEILA